MKWSMAGRTGDPPGNKIYYLYSSFKFLVDYFLLPLYFGDIPWLGGIHYPSLIMQLSFLSNVLETFSFLF